MTEEEREEVLEEAREEVLEEAHEEISEEASEEASEEVSEAMREAVLEEVLEAVLNYTQDETRNHRKTRQGVVVSATADKTCVVEIKARKAHPVYGKMVTRTKKFHVHDEENHAGVGDVVEIMETRPISKLKRWRLVDIIEKAK